MPDFVRWITGLVSGLRPERKSVGPMTSEEIQDAKIKAVDAATGGLGKEHWIVAALLEIAHQLAVGNEQQDVPKLKHNPFGESLAAPVRADSGSEVRGDGPWLDRDWMCANCDHINMAVRQSCRNCGLKRSASEAGARVGSRPSDERTTPPNPQTSSIQRQRTSAPDDSSEI